MATEKLEREADLLHPLVTTHWTQCHSLRRADPTHCAVLHDRVAILAEGGGRSSDVLHISSTDLQSWTTSTLPYKYMSLTTYKSKLVLVGGCHSSTGVVTNVLLSSDIELQWKETLPPMPTNRYWTSSVTTRSPEVLVVAGGKDSNDRDLDVVEVLIGDNWMTVKSLPRACYCMHSVFHGGNLYFIGGVGHGDTVYTCSCSSLMSLCEESTTTDTPLWSQFKAPGDYTTAVSYSSYLVSIDAEFVIRAYSNVTQSWLKITSTGSTDQLNTIYVTAAVLPTGELVCAYQHRGVYRVKINMSSFDPNSRFMSDVFSRLDIVMEVHIVSVLAKNYQQLTHSTKVRTRRFLRKVPMPDPKTSPHQYVDALMTRWIEGESRPPKWRELLNVLQDMGQAELGQQIDVFMKGGKIYKDLKESSELVEPDNIQQEKDFSLTDYPPLPKIIKEERMVLVGFSADDEVSVTYKGESGSLDWEEYGLTLLFERSDNSSEVGEYPVRVLAGESGAFRYPEKVEPASTIYHIDCPKQLPAPVTIRIKHDVPEEDLPYLCFITSSDDQPPYDYTILNGGNFTPTVAEISVRSFSKYGLGFLRKYIVKSILSIKEKSYATSLHCSVQPMLDSSGYMWNVYVSAMKNCSCFKRSIQKYIKQKYNDDVEEVVTEIVDFAETKDRITAITSFEHSLEEEIQLDPCKSPSIKKTAISRYVDATLPHIKYNLHVPLKLEGALLKIKITLEGLEEPENFLRLRLTVPNRSTLPLRRYSELEVPGACSGNSFTMKNLTVLHIGSDKQLHIIEEISSQWKQVGDLLGLRPSYTRVIEGNNPRNLVNCCREVMVEWLNDEKREYEYPPSWEGLCRLLKDLQLSAMAQDIENTVFK